MFLTRLSLPRRTLLRGLGATVALPFLEAMVPAMTATAQTAAARPRRWGAVFFPNGAIMEQWNPANAGVGFEFSANLQPLERFRDSIVVVSNLTRAGTTAGDHAVSAAGWLTGVYAKRTEAEDVRANTTIDQIVARQIGQDTPFPSLELATDDFSGYVGACTVGFSCVYANTLCWSSPTTPLPMEINPRVVFERLFGEPGTPEQRRAYRQRDLSILDVIRQEANALGGTLGTHDRTRLTQYLDNIREIERRIQRSEARTGASVDAPDAPVGIPDAFEEHVGLMFDLMAAAYEADLTRVCTFMMSRELSQRTYPQIGVPDQHHGVSHHQNDPAKIEKVVKINTYLSQLFAGFLEKLQATPDGDGSILDHSMIFYGGGMGNPNQHATGPLPMVVAGGGVPRRNRHLQLAPGTPVGNLWLTVANQLDNPMEKFGESSGTIDLF
jgi:hypothetical protein